ncbi:MAG: zinc ribbon domain-containing protein [Lachnospiraceae bacterium]|nr:zinc ribbon domain-containing protein [Lachnospiraceae bacterium]
MFVIIGTQIKKQDCGCLPEMRLCPRCRRAAYFQIIREQRWFTAFWVPLFPVHTTEYLQCPCCGLTFPMDQANETLPDKGAGNSSALQKGARQAGRLYGRFRKYLD